VREKMSPLESQKGQRAHESQRSQEEEGQKSQKGQRAHESQRSQEEEGQKSQKGQRAHESQRSQEEEGQKSQKRGQDYWKAQKGQTGTPGEIGKGEWSQEYPPHPETATRESQKKEERPQKNLEDMASLLGGKKRAPKKLLSGI
jgi:hypothetical protein